MECYNYSTCLLATQAGEQDSISGFKPETQDQTMWVITQLNGISTQATPLQTGTSHNTFYFNIKESHL